MPLQPLREADPRAIGPHRLLGRLGQGGMGTVYLGLTSSDRAVAVKVLRDGPADPDGRRRFQRELDALRRVRGPHLVEVLDADVDAPTPWIVTRFVAGQRLDEAVAANGPVRELTALALGLARGLATLHAAGVVHRDLTAGNVLLDEAGPQIIDLGLALVADVTMLTRTGLVVGTAGYLAPEQVLGTGSGPAVDIHAWGACVALAATGRPAYGTGRPDAVLFRVVHQPPDLLGVPARLLPLVARALDKDPARRPVADELVAALLADVPALAGRAGHADAAVPRAAPVLSAVGSGSQRTAYPNSDLLASGRTDALDAGRTGVRAAGRTDVRAAGRTDALPASRFPDPATDVLAAGRRAPSATDARSTGWSRVPETGELAGGPRIRTGRLVPLAVAGLAALGGLALALPMLTLVVLAVALAVLQAGSAALAAHRARLLSREARAGDRLAALAGLPVRLLRALLGVALVGGPTLVLGRLLALAALGPAVRGRDGLGFASGVVVATLLVLRRPAAARSRAALHDLGLRVASTPQRALVVAAGLLFMALLGAAAAEAGPTSWPAAPDSLCPALCLPGR